MEASLASQISSIIDPPFQLTKITCPLVPGSGDPMKVGVFGGIHGDEPSGPTACAALAAWAATKPRGLAGFELHLFPACNPSGLAACTRHAESGLDLNREFWVGSLQPEVCWLETELRKERYDVIIALHEDDTSPGMYGFVSGDLLSESLLEPALAAAEQLLPRNLDAIIDGFPAEGGIIREGYTGILSAPPEQRPRPLEIVFETPGHAPLELRTTAAVIAVQTILAEYRTLLALGANL
jgi:murein peptide amidase A